MDKHGLSVVGRILFYIMLAENSEEKAYLILSTVISKLCSDKMGELSIGTTELHEIAGTFCRHTESFSFDTCQTRITIERVNRHTVNSQVRIYVI